LQNATYVIGAVMISRLAPFLAAAVLLPAAAGAATYAARPAVAVDAKRIVGRDISWACGPVECLGSTEESRPLVLCQGLVKQAGRLNSFLVNGRALAAAELVKCNSVARAAAGKALASK
jgi:hypothetical protein